MDNTPTKLDTDAVNLVKSIRQTESGGNFQAQGKSGEYGAYQFTEPTWNATAKKYGISIPLKQASPEQQNEVAYKQIKEWKDAGHNVGEIASMWNAGVGRPDAYLDNNVGTNKYGVHYDTPTYAKNVATNYQKLKGQSSQGFNPTPYSNPTPGQFDLSGSTQETPKTDTPPSDPTLGEEISNRATDFKNAAASIVGGEQATGQSRVSGVLQAAGAGAGLLGDIVNKGLELIPGVKQVENLIGQGVGALAKTSVGQSVANAIKDFSEKHPELSKDIGAGFNIATAIPILKGIGAIKNIALDATSSALKNVAEKSATKDLTATAERTIGGRKALQSTPDAIKTLINERALPDIENNKYVTKEAFDKLGQNISTIEDTELQPLLKSVSTNGVDTRVPIEDLRQQALKDVRDEFKSGGNVGKAESEVNRTFDDYKNSYGDYVTLEDVNDMKRGIRKTVNFNSPKLESDVSYHLGQVFQKSIESSAERLGLADVGEINTRMAGLIKAQNMLKYIEGKPVKTGFVGGLIKDAATAGGEMAGNATGIPIAGAFAGREGGGYVGKKLSTISRGILKRTGKDAERTTIKDATKKVTKGLIGIGVQKAVK